MPISCLLPPHNDSILESFLNGTVKSGSHQQLIDWQRILVVPRTEMKCKCLFLALPSLFQNIQQGICFDFEHYFQQTPFPIPKKAFPEVVFILSKVFYFYVTKKWCTDILEPTEQKDARGSTWKLLSLSNFFILF